MTLVRSSPSGPLFEVIGEGRSLLRAPQYLLLTETGILLHPPGTDLVLVQGVAAGGAGAGGTATSGSGGSLGGSGTYGEKAFTDLLTSGVTSSTYTVGVGGLPVSGADGNPGTASTFTCNGVTVTLPPGLGGLTMPGGATLNNRSGGLGGGPVINADFSVPGQQGGFVIRPQAAVAPLFQFGSGGCTPIGQGGLSAGVIALTVVGSGRGPNAVGFGSGGSGWMNGSGTTAGPGSAGMPGMWKVMEFS